MFCWLKSPRQLATEELYVDLRKSIDSLVVRTGEADDSSKILFVTGIAIPDTGNVDGCLWEFRVPSSLCQEDKLQVRGHSTRRDQEQEPRPGTSPKTLRTKSLSGSRSTS